MKGLIEVGLALAELQAAKAVKRPSPKLSSLGAVAVASLCAAGALLCSLAALWIFLRPLIGAASAALGVAGILLVIGGLAYWLMQRPAKPPPAPLDTLSDAVSPLLLEGARLLRDHPVSSVGTAFLIGLVASRITDTAPPSPAPKSGNPS